MARALSEDLRSRVLKATAEGASARQAAAYRARSAGSAELVSARRHTDRRADAHADFIVGMIKACRDITLDEMVERSMRIGRSTLSDWLRGRGWTFKKSPHMHWSRSVPTS